MYCLLGCLFAVSPCLSQQNGNVSLNVVLHPIQTIDVGGAQHSGMHQTAVFHEEQATAHPVVRIFPSATVEAGFYVTDPADMEGMDPGEARIGNHRFLRTVVAGRLTSLDAPDGGTGLLPLISRHGEEHAGIASEAPHEPLFLYSILAR